MRGIARQGDIAVGICTCHNPPIWVSGKVITYSNTVKVNGRGVARDGDIVKATCGHIGNIVTHSSPTEVDSRKVARLGDKTSGCFKGTLITASGNTDDLK
jgi:uncharacterized Zn-binding protein involved in type VI secretion